MKTRILLADDHEVFREGLRSMIEKHDDLEVVGDAETGRVAVRMATQLKPDIIIMDIAMPDLNGIEATSQIRANVPEARVIALSMHSDKRFVTGMLRAGAVGYLLKASAFDEVIQATRTVMNNKHYVSGDIADTVVSDYVRQLTEAAPEQHAALSPREREVLQLLAEGHSTRKIAEALHISANTIETHRAHIMAKLGIKTIADLVKFAIREGITSLE
ncbi:MAG: response regulator transcription factor [Candidatus Hydrogenedentes bacterium]|nr:response regulator transcription factor [Candidatus Hydrogenedentota bacterium]